MSKPQNLEKLNKRLKKITGSYHVTVASFSNLSKWKQTETIKLFGQIKKLCYDSHRDLLGDLEKSMPEEVYKALMKLDMKKNQNISLRAMLRLRIL